MSDSLPHSAPSSAERERVIASLSEAYAAERLELDQLEQRMALVYRATSHEALAAILADLPGHAPLPATRPARRAAAAGVADIRPADDYGIARLADYTEITERGVVMGVLGGADRRGSWVVPRTLRVVSVMGGVSLDMREARFAPGVTELDIFCLWGGVELLLPDGLRVEVVGAGVLGGFSVKGGDAPPGPDVPVLRLSGLALMGGVDANRKRFRNRRE